MGDSTILTPISWKIELPVLVAGLVTLREPAANDTTALFNLLSTADATRFGLEDPITELGVRQSIDRALADRSAGKGFTCVVIENAPREIVGLIQVRQLDPSFEAAECEGTIAPAARGRGIFVEAARLAGSLAFGAVGARRLESRVLLENGRANGALRKLGAVQEGVLRRSVRRHGEYVDQVLWSMLKEDWGELWLSTAPRVH